MLESTLLATVAAVVREGSFERAARTLPVRIDDEAEPLPGFRHTFSHYHLDVQPLRWRVRAIEGVGERKLSQYGETFVAAIAEFGG